MAILSCPQCKCAISSEAIACPHCHLILTGVNKSYQPSFQNKRLSDPYPQQKTVQVESNSPNYTGWILGVSVAILFLLVSQKSWQQPSTPISAPEVTNSQNTLPAPKQEKPCTGNKSCITAVRSRCRELNYDIMGETYLGNGIIGISAIDYSRPGYLWNIKFFTNCNCEIINVDVKRVYNK